MYKPITDIAIYAPLLAANGNKQVYTDGATLVGLTDANGDPVLDGNGAQLTQWMYPVTDKCERSAVVMGDDYVRLSFDLATRVQFAAFSFIEYNGQTFFLRETYRPKNNGTYRDRNGVVSSTYTYDMRFVSLGNMLTKHTCLRNVVVVNETWNEPEININGTLDTLYTMIIGSIEQAALRIRNERQYYRQCLLSLVANKANARLTPNTDLVTFSFSGAKIADCLTTIANGYDETEWFITEDNGSFTLNIAKHEVGENVAILHLSDEKYENTGADKDVHPTLSGGLTSCEYAQEWNGIVQRITPFGSDRNMVKQTGVDSNTDMMVSYGKRLRLDPNHKVRWQSGMTYEAWVQASTSGATFGSLYPTTAMKRRGVTGCYVVKDKQGNAVLLEVDKDGAVTNPDTNVDTGIEEVVMYDEVYPQCHFKITSVEEKTKRIDGELQPRYTIEGVAVDENKYPKSVLANLGMFPIRIIEAETLSVVFESGLLNGREFEITNKTTKDEGVTEYSLRFSIVADGDITEGTLIPSGNFKPNVNDQFALFNMKMPDEFIDMARDELAQKAYDDLIELENTRPEVKCVADEDIFEQYDIYLGRRCEVTSEIFVSDAHFISRVISYSYPLSAPSRVSFSLASAIMEGTISSIESSIGEQTGQIGGLNQRTVNLSRRGWHDASEMAEMLDGITTPMMLVGVEKNQFQYTSSVQCVNGRMNGGVEHFDHLTIGNGVLQHTQKDWIDWHDGRWYIEPVDDLHLCNDSGDSINSVANQEKPFYLYAFCQEDSEYAQMKLYDMDYTSEHHIEEDVHYLLLGILSSEFVDGGTAYRVFNRTNGYTQIAGGTITTEVLQDPTSNLIIDMAHKPPRIIAKGGAEIIGNIRFKSFTDESGNNPLETIVNSISVGGRNLLRDTAFSKKGANLVGWSFSGGGGTRQTHADDDTIESSAVKIVLNNNSRVQLSQTAAKGYNTVGDTYTFSAKMKSDAEKTIVFRAGYGASTTTAVIGTSWTDVKITCEVTGTGGSSTYKIFYLFIQGEVGGTLYIKEAMLEKGALASVWAIAPEDTAADIQENKNYADQLAADLKTQIDGVVNSYFFEGVPTLENTPAVEWTTNDEKKLHVGDTYTNIQSYTNLGASMWELGAIGVGSSSYKNKTYAQCKYTHASRIRTKDLIPNQPGQILFVPSDYTIMVSKFDSNGLYLGSYVSYSTSTALPTDADTAQIALQLAIPSGVAQSVELADTLGLCVNPTAGHSWRFTQGGTTQAPTFSWEEIADSDAVRALQQAAAAQDTADGKRRVFSTDDNTLPVPPYDEGDLWANATYTKDGATYTNVLLKCTTSRAKGDTPAIADWIDSSRAISAADAAQITADAAVDNLNNMASDGVITTQEKLDIKREWLEADSEYTKNAAQADTYISYGEVASRKSILTSKYGELKDYLLGKSSGSPATGIIGHGGSVSDTEMKKDTTEASVVNTLAGKFKAFYDANVDLLNAISNAIKIAAYADSVGYVDAIKEALQNQIDGVVDSYFMEGAPTLSNAPANEWTTEDDRKRHEGDTYTNIQNYQQLGSTMWEQGAISLGTSDIGKPISKWNKPNSLRMKDYITYKAGDTLYLGNLSSNYYAIIAYLGEENGQIVVKEAQWSFVNGNKLKDTYSMCAVQIRPVSSYDSSAPNSDVEWADTYGFCINPTAGHSWRFCKGTEDSPATTWHWHEIADSDAVLALQKAAEAQDTADGKRRVFTKQPVPPYDEGDLWANATYNVGDSKDPLKYTNALLKCKKSRASGSFDIADWEDSSRAISAADAAQASATDALNKAANIVDDGIISGGTEKGTLKKEWQEVAGENYNGTGSGSYYKAISEASKYNVGYSDLTTAFNNLKTLMQLLLGSPTPTDAKMKEDTTLANLSANYNTKDKFIGIWRSYYDAEVELYNSISKAIDEGSGDVNLISWAMLIRLNTYASGVTTIGVDNGEGFIALNCPLLNNIGSSGTQDIFNGQIAYDPTKQYCLKVDCKCQAASTKARLSFMYSDGTKSAFTLTESTTRKTTYLVSTEGKSVVGITNVSPSSGRTATAHIYHISLTEGKRVPDDWIEAEEDVIYGGENLYTGVDPLEIASNATSAYNYRQLKLSQALKNGSKYVVSVGSISQTNSAKQCHICLYSFDGDILSKAVVFQSSQTPQSCTFTVPSDGKEYKILFYSGLRGNCYNIGATFSQIMVQEGTKATSYQASYKYLAEAFEHDATQQTTDINGGLVATSLIKLRNKDGQVTAGMSGLNDHNNSGSEGVTLWGGGDYAAALAAAAGNGDIAVLLTKTGLKSRIGCFRVVDKDTIKVVTDNNEIVFTNGSISNAAPSTQSVEGDGTININKEYSVGESTITYSSAAISSTFPKGNYYLTSNATSLDVKIQIRTSRYGQYNWYQGRAQFTFKIELYVKVGGSIVSTQTVGTYQTDIYSTGTSDTNSRTDTIQISKKTVTFACNSNNTSVEIGYRLADTSVVVSNITGSGAKGIITIKSETITSKLIQTNRYVVIAKDGIAIINSSEAMFKISNGSGQLKLYASGLPTSASGITAGSGQIWQDGDYLKIK